MRGTATVCRRDDDGRGQATYALLCHNAFVCKFADNTEANLNYSEWMADDKTERRKTKEIVHTELCRN